MYREISRCRLTGSKQLVPILSLGWQHLTGVFPRSPDAEVAAGPVELVFCPDGGLVQLKATYALDQLYGANYGYRSGLNRSMVSHLRNKVARLESLVSVSSKDLVLDIGSNDGTLLGAYADKGQTRVGLDPSAGKFLRFYEPGIDVLVDFFSAAAFRQRFGGRRAKIVTSIAMFYDLDDPMAFVRDVADVLAPDGVWHTEQSYMPLMLERNAYDTVCHEHLEYYALRQLKRIADRAGLKIVDVELNEINGGSFAVTLAHAGAPYPEAVERVEQILAEEQALGLQTLAPYEGFRQRVFRHRDDLKAILSRLQAERKTVAGIGASTKGNALLQFCGIDATVVPFISEVNPDKFGCYTPGSKIPIIPETEARQRRPDYLLVLPWHFRDNLIEREQEYLSRGGKMIFPLPKIEIINADGVLV
ncbi:MAG: class I SAM-dependent methyltransferase [Lacisediminihabitans sp.]